MYKYCIDRSLLDCLFRAVRSVIMELFQKLNKRKNFVPGFVCVLHTFGRPLEWNPHIHRLLTEGGFSDDGFWRNVNYFNYTYLRKAFQTALLNEMEKKIASSRVDSYDGENVTFHYNKHEDDSYVEKTLPVLDFIQLLIQHIPEKHFKITRYYGLYTRRRELDKTIRKAVDPCKHKIILDWKQWRNLIFLSFGYDPLECPKCKHKMVFMELYQKHKRVPLEELYEKAMAPYRCQSKGPPGKCA